jgi:hypothetical protein
MEPCLSKKLKLFSEILHELFSLNKSYFYVVFSYGKLTDELKAFFMNAINFQITICKLSSIQLIINADSLIVKVYVENAMIEKFQKNVILKNVLLKTQKKILFHFLPRKQSMANKNTYWNQSVLFLENIKLLCLKHWILVFLRFLICFAKINY